MVEIIKRDLIITNSRGISLHSEWYRSGKIIQETPLVILCHGFTGDKHEVGRFSKTAEVLVKHGYDCLLFDFSGSGENKREPITLEKQTKDLEDVFAWSQNKQYKRIATIGLSFGGITSLVSNLPDRKVSIYWAPGFYIKNVIGKIKIHIFIILSRLSKKPMTRESGDENYLPILMDGSFLTSIVQHPPEKYLKSIKIPTLIVHGQEDTVFDIKWSRKALKFIPKDIPHQLIEISDTGHTFKGEYLDQFIKSSITWLDKYL